MPVPVQSAPAFLQLNGSFYLLKRPDNLFSLSLANFARARPADARILSMPG